MLEWLPSIISGAGGIASALMGGNAESQSALAQYYNWLEQREANRRQQEAANKLYRTQTAPVIDAQGNRTEYIEGVGWVSTPSEATRNIINASQAEELARLTGDAAQARRGRDENERRRYQEGQVADAYLRELLGTTTPDAATIRDLLVRAAGNGNAEAFDRAQANASRVAVRTGTSGEDVQGSLARERADAAADAQVNAQQQALVLAEQLKGQHDSRVSSLYNLFAQRAANKQDVPFQPEQYTGQLSATAQNTRNASSNAGMALISTAGATAPRPTTVNNAGALASGSIFDSLGGIANEFYQKNKYDDLLTVLKGRLGTNSGGW